jgi:pyruvate dehydrogenase E1 component alpha subunit
MAGKSSSGKVANASAVNRSSEHLLKLYKEMLLIRRFEERAAQLYGMGMIGGFCHLYIGQEAVVVGLNAMSEPGDMVITSYRDHGHIIMAGAEPTTVMAELTGRATGCSKGKGGSMHMFHTDNHFYGGHGIVGAQVPLGTGLAFAAKYRKQNNVSFTYFGDGAVNQGQVYEAFNMAALWKLPVLYIVENNEYSMGTSVCRSTFMTDLYRKGESFGIPGKQIDGMDIFAVMEEGKKAMDYVRAGNGPMLLEMKTYRYRGHSMSDPAKYRTKEEVNKYKDTRDPIDNLRNYMLANKLAKEGDFDNIEKEVKDEMTKVVEFAQNSPEPDVAELYTEVYSG